MENLPFAKYIRINYWILYRNINEKRKLQKEEKELEAYIYICESEFFKPTDFEYNINNEEYIKGLKWELQGINTSIYNYTKRIKKFRKNYKPTTLG